jgi:hypothetical protein
MSTLAPPPISREALEECLKSARYWHERLAGWANQMQRKADFWANCSPAARVSNRRPSHDEEERQCPIWPLPAALRAAQPAPGALACAS